MKEVFAKGILKYNIRNCRVTYANCKYRLPRPKSRKYGADTIAYKAAQLWNTLSPRYKNVSSLDLFKSQIKSWHCSDCPSSTCKIFVNGVGFIN